MRVTMTAEEAISIAAQAWAESTKPTRTSALSCIEDAEKLLAKEERLYAAQRALESIAYSEGVFSARYSRVANGIGAY